MKEEYIEMFGIISNICFTSSLLPQIIKILKTKKTEDISIVFLGICIMGEVFFILYDSYRDIGTVVYSAYASLVLYNIILFLCFYYKKKRLTINNTDLIENNTNIENKTNIETIIL